MDAVEFVKEINRMCSTYTPKRCEGGGVIWNRILWRWQI